MRVAAWRLLFVVCPLMMALRLVLMLCNCSSDVNWASCAVNWVLSIGSRGFWCCNWVTSSFKKVSFGLSFEAPVAVPEDAAVADDAAVVDVVGDGLVKTSP